MSRNVWATTAIRSRGVHRLISGRIIFQTDIYARVRLDICLGRTSSTRQVPISLKFEMIIPDILVGQWFKRFWTKKNYTFHWFGTNYHLFEQLG